MEEERKESVEKMKQKLLEHIETEIGSIVEASSNCTSIPDLKNASFTLSPSIYTVDKRKSSVDGRLPEKVFRSRDSPLTELLEVPHFKSIHHIFIATLSLFMIHALVIDLFETGKLDFGVDMLLWAFGQRQTLFVMCFVMNLITMFGVYPCFYFWATSRQDLKSETLRKFDLGAGIAFLVFLLAFIFVPMGILIVNPLPPASGAAVTMEQCRLLMKIYAFVRSAAPRVIAETTKDVYFTAVDSSGTETADSDHPNGSGLRKRVIGNKGKQNGAHAKQMRQKRQSWIIWNEEESAGCPGFSKFIYFLFAPTLIYKDSYPMRDSIRWDHVCWNFAQCIGCIVYANFILSRFSTAFFSHFGQVDSPMNLTQLTHALFSMMLPGIMCLILAFFLILHAWQNAFAEMLCFGDRLFYKDWWNCSSFSAYYKTWNLIVHDWLYTYVFKDATELGLGKIWGPLPTTLVFAISSMFHEYILCFSFNFFFPVLLTLFGGFGFGLIFVKGGKSAFGNVLMWMCLISGTGIILTLYTMEYYARINCPPAESFDFFKPRALTCGAISFTLS